MGGSAFVWMSFGDLVAQTEPLKISSKKAGGGHELTWTPKIPRWTGSPLEMRNQVYQSNDLETWEPIGEPQTSDGASELKLALSAEHPQRYYRLEVAPEFKFFDKNTETVVSYGDQRDFHYNEVADLSVDTFEESYGPSVRYREQIDWDVTKAQYWDQFAMSPEEHNANRPANDPERRLYDFRLNDNEKAVMQQNGFVVTSRHQRNTFVDLLYDIWTDDLPVYFSTDAALHAWHRTFQPMLAELEEIYLQQTVAEVITEMRSALPTVWEAHGDGPLAEGLSDADFYLTVAASLASQPVDPVDAATLGQAQTPYLQSNTQRLAEWLGHIEEHEFLKTGEGPFGTPGRLTDFSQFTVRGNYESSASLATYFRLMMWLGRTDFRMGGGSHEAGTLRQLAGAVTLSLLLKDSGQEERWKEVESVLSTFVGLSDSMTPPQMLSLLEAENLASFDTFDDSQDLSHLQAALLNGSYGKQEINSSFIENCDPVTIVAPRAFAFFGQRFTPDSWTLAEVTYDRLPIMRRLPTSLDVAMATLDNRASVPLLIARMQDANGVPLGDGLPYQSYLAAAHATFQSQEPAFWTANVYQHWLGSLRALSAPTTGEAFPQAMQTNAWAMKNLNTQLASWTQLRHDTVLYAKQSVTPPFLCDYPAGYVEPRVAFWRALGTMARSFAERFAALSMSGDVTVRRLNPFAWDELSLVLEKSFSRESAQQGFVSHLEFFAETMNTLAEISEQELAGLPMTDDQLLFMKNLAEDLGEYAGKRTYSGWYPQLYLNDDYVQFVTEKHPSDVWDALVTDVHTDAPSDCVTHSGRILHEAVGNIDFMMVGVEHGDQGCVFAGPVFSYYEFIEPYPKRLSDSEWKTRIENGELPPRPSWTNTYLID